MAILWIVIYVHKPPQHKGTVHLKEKQKPGMVAHTCNPNAWE